MSRLSPFTAIAKRPVILSPMANAGSTALAIAVAQAGGIGSLPAASWSVDELRDSIKQVRTADPSGLDPIVNFFAHQSPKRSSAEDLRWLEALAPLYEAEGIPMHARDTVNFHRDTPSVGLGSLPHWFRRKVGRQPFDGVSLKVIEELQLKCVSFHFGLPQWPDASSSVDDVVSRIRQASPGIHILSTATTVDEAVWLAKHGADAVIAQGTEAGGHRGTFLSTSDVTSQLPLKDLVAAIHGSPEFRRYSIPLIAAGGIATRQDVKDYVSAGAAAVQVGTRFLNCLETTISDGFRSILSLRDDSGHSPLPKTTLTRCFTGRVARAISNRATEFCSSNVKDTDIPVFPNAVDGWSHLRYRAESKGCWMYTPMLCGERFELSCGNPESAKDVARTLLTD